MSRPKSTVAALAAMLALAVACSQQSASPTSPGAQTDASANAAADGSTLKVTAPTPNDPINDKQVNDNPTLTAGASAVRFGNPVALTYRFQVFGPNGATVQDSGLVGSPSFRITAQLAFKARHTWRVRAEYQGQAGPWSSTASFVSPEGGYIRTGEVFDPIYNGTTVGEVIGPVTFLGAEGARLESVSSFIRYLIPGQITSGEFSVEVKGLRPNAPGDKSKVFGMQQGTGDYITDPFRVDIQYRGSGGFPPNAILFRVLNGGQGPFEPTTEQRFASQRNLNPNTTYFWKATWGSSFRVTVTEGAANGPVVYDLARNTTGTYNPNPYYAFIGTPTGRSGAESASIPGAIYKNVWISSRPRPQ